MGAGCMALWGREKTKIPLKKIRKSGQSLIRAIIFDTYPTQHVLLKVELLKKDHECFDT